MNRLEKIILQLQKGEIGEEKALQMLERDAEREDSKWIVPVEVNEEYNGDPLEELIRRESQEEQIEILKKIFSDFTFLERVLIYLVMGEGWTIRRFSRVWGVPKSTAFDILTKAWETIPDKITKKSCSIYRGIFYRRISKGGRKVKAIGFPFELARRVNIGGVWRNHAGRRVFVSRSECRLAQYFHATFGDTKTVCPLCLGGC